MAIIPGRRAASSPETISLHLMMVSAFALAAHREDVIRWARLKITRAKVVSVIS
jgi:hypothetical protein